MIFSNFSCRKPCQNKKGRKFVSAAPKMVQLKQIFGPSYFVTALDPN